MEWSPSYLQTLHQNNKASPRRPSRPTSHHALTSRDAGYLPDDLSFREDERFRPPRTLPPSISLPPPPTGSMFSNDASPLDPYETSGGPYNPSRSFLAPPSPPASPPPGGRSTTPISSRRRRGTPEDFFAAAAEAGLQRRLFERVQAARRDDAMMDASATTEGRPSRSNRSAMNLGSSAPRPSYDGAGAGGYPTHLPLVEQSRINGITALPNSFVMRDIEYSVMKLVSEKVRDFVLPCIFEVTSHSFSRSSKIS